METIPNVDHLRPIERCVAAMSDQGVGIGEIAERLRRSPEHIERMMWLMQIPRSGPPERHHPSPMARRVLALRRQGEDYATIGARFRRGADFIKRVEGMAHYRRGVELLS